MIDFDKLNQVLDKCREAAERNELCSLPDNFYHDTAKYVKMLDDETNKASGCERDMLSDEAKNTKLLVESIMCQRQSNIVHWAVVDAGNQKCRDIENWNHWDRVLYTEVFIAIDEYQTETFKKIMLGEAPKVKF
jgi:DNA replication initiation complex subunit (GINS family)